MGIDECSRREAVFKGAAIAGGAALLAARPVQAAPTGGAHAWERSYSGGAPDVKAMPPGEPGRDYTPTITPGCATAPWKIVDGVKVFHLVAEEVLHEFAP